jgi:hypothetical protein
MGLFVGAIAVVVLVLIALRSGSGGLGAVSLGLSEVVLLGIPALVVVAGATYFALRRLGWSRDGLATHGSIIFGGGAALIAALWMARSLSISGGS